MPSRPEDLLGYVVLKPSWEPRVRWHPVWDIPRAPRKLPESSGPERPTPPLPGRAPPLPTDPPPQQGGYLQRDPYMMGGPINSSLMPSLPHGVQPPYPGIPMQHSGIGPSGMHPGIPPPTIPPDPYIMGDWVKGGPQRRGKGGGGPGPMKGRGGPYGTPSGWDGGGGKGGKGGKGGGKGKSEVTRL